MSMRVITVETLIEKAHFEPRVAVAVSQAMDEAIDTKIGVGEFVTVPVLDVRLAGLESRLKGGLLRHLYLALLGQFATLVGTAYFMTTHLK